jgi:hypothetical protein
MAVVPTKFHGIRAIRVFVRAVILESLNNGVQLSDLNLTLFNSFELNVFFPVCDLKTPSCCKNFGRGRAG